MNGFGYKRLNVVNEVLQTEKSYVESLQNIVQVS